MGKAGISKRAPLFLYIKSNWITAILTGLRTVCGAFALQWQSHMVVTETSGTTEPQVFTTWLCTEECGCLLD